MLTRPWRGARGARPSGPFVLNGDSPQAYALLNWWACAREALIAVRTNTSPSVVPTVTMLGSPTSAYVTPSVEGLGAHTDLSNAGLNQRAFNTGLPGALDGLSAFTVAYWVTQIVDANGVSWWGQGTGNSVFCESALGGTRVTGPYLRGIGDFRNAFTEYAVVDTDKVQHFAWTVAAGDHVIQYYNGIQKQSNAASSASLPAADTSGFYIGGQPSGSGGSTAAIDAAFLDFRIYSRALSAAEVWALYEPATRWDLYWTPSNRIYFDVGAVISDTLEWRGCFPPAQRTGSVNIGY